MRRGRTVARVLLASIGCAIVLALVLSAAVYFASERRFARVYPQRPVEIVLRTDPASLERGRHLAVHVALCTWCHGDDLGGRATADDPWIGRLHASNLTSGAGGVGAHYTNADFERAIRAGIAPGGRSLLLMPSHYFRRLSDDDVAAIIAWLRAAAPVDSAWPPTAAGPLTRVALVVGLAPELITAEQVAKSSRSAGSAALLTGDRHLGAYLVDLGACRVCHHADLSGGLHALALPGEPPPSDLRPVGPLRSWSEADFVRAMRSGLAPDGRRLSPDYMPWPRFAGMTDAELAAIFDYLANPDSNPS